MTKATKVHKAFISAWTKILVHLPLRFRLWWMHRSNERQLRLLDNRYGPLLEAARKAKDDENKESVHAEYTRERVLILMPTYMAVDAMLEREARKRGIRVPEKNEGKGDWIRELVTDNWMLTAEAERVLRNEIREEQRAHNDEMRKWATLFFILVGTIFAFLSLSTRKTS